MPEYDPVTKISIVPRGQAGGLTFFAPSEERLESGLYRRAPPRVGPQRAAGRWCKAWRGPLCWIASAASTSCDLCDVVVIMYCRWTTSCHCNMCRCCECAAYSKQAA